MIKNQVQYEYTKECASRFAYSIALIEKDEAWKQRDAEGWQLDIDVKKSHLEALQEEISEYARLKNCDEGQPIKIQVENFNKLPDVLIKARIAAKMTEKELADILGVSEERIKECEKKDYQCASFIEIINITEALGVEFKNASVEVNFEEIKEFKKWHQSQQEKRNIRSTTSPNESNLEIA